MAGINSYLEMSLVVFSPLVPFVPGSFVVSFEITPCLIFYVFWFAGIGLCGGVHSRSLFIRFRLDRFCPLLLVSLRLLSSYKLGRIRKMVLWPCLLGYETLVFHLVWYL